MALHGLIRVWVEPGASGICMFALQPPEHGTTTRGSYGACSRDLAQVTADGMKLNVKLAGRKRIVVGVVPDTNRTVRVRRRAGAITTAPVVDGVYTVPTGLRHIYITGISR